jgi:hypothetical protein
VASATSAGSLSAEQRFRVLVRPTSHVGPTRLAALPLLCCDYLLLFIVDTLLYSKCPVCSSLIAHPTPYSLLPLTRTAPELGCDGSISVTPPPPPPPCVCPVSRPLLALTRCAVFCWLQKQQEKVHTPHGRSGVLPRSRSAAFFLNQLVVARSFFRSPVCQRVAST